MATTDAHSFSTQAMREQEWKNKLIEKKNTVIG